MNTIKGKQNQEGITENVVRASVFDCMSSYLKKCIPEYQIHTL